MSPARALLKTLRPHQWVKNLFVAAPVVFAKRLGDPEHAARSLLAVAAFCALSGAVYVLNDVIDVEKDRSHPTKCRRPIASGALSPGAALVFAALLAVVALATSFLLAPAFGVVALGYLVLNLAYSFRLKEIAFVDVLAISGGFLLRVLGGAYAVHVPTSPWLLACTGLLAAFLGFGKRAHELALAHRSSDAVGATGASSSVGATRAVLTQYREGHLKAALYVCGLLTTVAYGFYTQSSHTMALFGGRSMGWTAPFCLVGLARFLHLVTRRGEAEEKLDSPTDAMLHDGPFLANLALWGAVVLAIIYFQ